MSKLEQICELYDISLEEGENIVTKFPQFAGYNHARVIRKAVDVYGDEARIKEAILRHPQFAGYNHARVIREAIKVYGTANESRIKEAILRHPQFAGLDHAKTIGDAVDAYGIANESRIKEAILKFPSFAGYNHSNVIQRAVDVYGDDTKVKEAILKFPQFAGYDHKRVLRQKTRIGRLIGLTDQETIGIILETPVQAGYSYKRDLARIDVARTLESEGLDVTSEVRSWLVSNYMKSPYSPNTRLRISQSQELDEPKLLTRARRRFTYQLKVA